LVFRTVASICSSVSGPAVHSTMDVMLGREAPVAAYRFGVGRFSAFARSASVVILVLLSLSFALAPGTADMDRWQLWARNMDRLGVSEGYSVNHGDYPPYAAVILLGARRLGAEYDVPTLVSIKLAILGFLLLTTTILYLWTRSFWLAVLSHVSLLLGTVALGYLDAFFAPALIVSLWALKERRLVLFAFSYSAACLIKWQPTIIAPFIALHLWNLLYGPYESPPTERRSTGRILIPVAAVVAPTVLLFGIAPIWGALVNATSHSFLSGNALNINWILTHWLHVYRPAQFGGLEQGQAAYIRTSLPSIVLAPRLLFYATFAIAILAYSKREKTFEQLVHWSLLGYLSYFMLNTGVHENHLFIAVLLSIVLFWTNAEHRWLMLLVTLASNLNLLVFYGVTGTGLRVSRVIMGTVDCALILSTLNVVAFSGAFIASIRPRAGIESTTGSVSRFRLGVTES
jgi:hypothetical protein